MSFDFTRCCVCYSDYDLQDHIPVILSQCGHNTCQMCVESLLASQRECPICRKKFSTDEGTLYVPNLLIKEQLEKESLHHRCPTHPNHLLELYCLTDNSKICIDCHFDKGKDGHKGHEVERIMDFKEQLDAKRKIFETKQAKYQAIYDESKSLLGKRRQEQLDNFRSVERIAKLVVLEAYLAIKTVFDEEESKLEEEYGENSSVRQEIEAKINQYKDIKKADLKMILDEDAEKLAGEFDKPELMEYFENLKSQTKTRNLVLPTITQDHNKICIEAPGSLLQYNMNSFLSFSLEDDTLTVTANSFSNKNVCIEMDKWEKDVKSIKFIFNAFNYNTEDQLLLDYIWTKLQPQIHSISLEYKTIWGSEQPFEFQNHLSDFSKNIFSHPQNFKEIELKFVQASGAEHYTKLLIEKILLKTSQLTSLKLLYEDSDVTESTVINFVKESKVLLKNLTEFWFVLQNFELKADVHPHYFSLPNLRDFKFSTNINSFSFTILQGFFLGNSLTSMKALEKCVIELNGYHTELSHLEKLVKIFPTMPELGTVEISMPHVNASLSTLTELAAFSKNMKEPRNVSIKVSEAEFGTNSNLAASNTNGLRTSESCSLFRNTTSNTTPSSLFANLNLSSNMNSSAQGGSHFSLFGRVANRWDESVVAGTSDTRSIGSTGLFLNNNNNNSSRSTLFANSQPGEPSRLFRNNNNATREGFE